MNDDDALMKMKMRAAVNAQHAENVRNAHWIKGAFRTITCSNCGFLLRVPDAIIPKFAYCPHRGAKMDENEDE